MGTLNMFVAVALLAQSAVAIALESAHQSRLVLKTAAPTTTTSNFFVSHIAAPGAVDAEEMQVSFAAPVEQAVKAAPGADAAFLKEHVSGGEQPAGPTTVRLHFNTATNALSATTGADADKDAPAGSKFLAGATWDDTIPKEGWATLRVKTTDDDALAEMSSYAAGFLEGALSTKRIQEFRHNANALMKSDEQKHHALPNVKKNFRLKIDSMLAQTGIKENANLFDASGRGSVGRSGLDPWWLQARFMLLQALGIRDGFNARRSKMEPTMSLMDLMVLSSDGETPELEMAFDTQETLLRESRNDPDSFSDDDGDSAAADKKSALVEVADGDDLQDVSATSLLQKGMVRGTRAHKKFGRPIDSALIKSLGLNDDKWRAIQRHGGRCSAMIRLSEKDLFFGHTTFSDFSEMTRVFKYYDMPLPGAAAKKIMFSSYPGVAGSTDDYYVTDSGLAVTETTISMLTDEVYDVINDTPKKQEIPDYMRILLSTRVATSGKHWIDLMKQSATGLYSSQWMVVDSNKIQKTKDSIKLSAGAFHVLDQIPGTQHSEDMTETLKKQGYWGSQNRAWFDDVRDHMGATQAEEMDGRVFSKDKSPRAVIFKATAGSVESLEEMKKEMQRNRWPHEVDGGELI